MVLNKLVLSIVPLILIASLVISLSTAYFPKTKAEPRPSTMVSTARIRRKLTTYTGFRSEFIASTTSMTEPYYSGITIFSDESFVVTWSGEVSGSSNDLFTQIFSKDGSKVGSEIRENESSVYRYAPPSVIGIDNDDFILYFSIDDAVTSNDVYAKKYYNTGTAMTSKTMINDWTNSQQYAYGWIRLTSGNILAFFTSGNQAGDNNFGVFAHQIDTNMNRIGSVLHVNTYTTNNQQFSSACVLKGGGFVVTWSSFGQATGNTYDIYAQLYDDSLNRVGSEFMVNTNTDGDQAYSDVVCLDDGGFVTVWQTEHANNIYSDIAAQKFDSNGNIVGSEIKVNDEVNKSQLEPIAILLNDGNFLISWHGFNPNNIYNIKIKLYDSDLNVLIPQNKLTDTLSNNEKNVSGAAFESGGYVLCYSNSTTDDLRCRISEPCHDSHCSDCFSDSSECNACSAGYRVESGVCIQCHSLCETCSGSLENQCLTCYNGVSPYFGYCECPSPSVVFWENPLLCGTCDFANCYECTCSNCSYSIVDGNNPIVCKVCNHRYFLQGNDCVKCGEYCSVCDDVNECVVCEGLFEVSDGYCVCPEGYYFKEGECLSCDSLCSICDENECFACKPTLVFDNGNCVCPHNYSLVGDSCSYSPLDYTISLQSYFILLDFNENLQGHLSSSSITKSYFLPDHKEFEFAIDPVSLSEYVLRIEDVSVPSNTNGIHIEFVKLTGSSGASLDESRTNVDLNIEETEDYVQEDSEELDGVSTEEVAEGTSISGAASVVGVSFISGNPSSLWAFLNFMTLIYYMPLQNVGMPVKIKNHFQSFSFDFADMIPSVDKISNTTSDSSPPGMWVDYGITSTDFITNNKSFLLLFGTGIFLFLAVGLVLALVKEGKCKEKLNTLYGHIKWNYFLRVWTQYYIKIVLGCLLSIGTMTSEDYNIVQWLSILLYTFSGVSVVFIVVGTYRNRSAIEEGNLENYASFYDEFKCDKGLLSMLFYPLFFLRRYLYITGLYYLQDFPTVQVFMNSLFSVLAVVFLICYRPFKDSSLNCINILLELIVASMFMLSGFFLIDLSEDVQDKISTVLFVLSVGAISMFIFLMLFKIFYALRDFRGKEGTVSEKEIESEAMERNKEEEDDQEITFNTVLGLSNREISVVEISELSEEYHRRNKSTFN